MSKYWNVWILKSEIKMSKYWNVWILKTENLSVWVQKTKN
jgi:hypothetical protein